MSHTKEPWWCDGDTPYISSNASAELRNKWCLKTIDTGRHYGNDIAVANARRIVACVNKFEGLTTDQIESMPVSVLQMSEFVDAINVSRDTYRDLCEELKNRLIAARFMFAIYGINLKQLGDQINESITKAEAILGEKK